MKIDREDLYHGAALAQIASSGTMAAVSKIRRNHFLVTVLGQRRGRENRYLYLKYLSRRSDPYRFVVSRAETAMLHSELTRSEPVFLGLVGADECICLLDRRQIQKVLSDEGPVEIDVSVPERASMRVARHGSRAKPIIVKHSDFPRKVLA